MRVALQVSFAVMMAATGVEAAQADIVLREKFPTRGKHTEIFVQDADGMPVAGAAVKVTYRPGSSVEAFDELGTTGPSGRLAWLPTTAGIATLAATWDGGSTSSNVSVKFESAPAGGIIIMILAGVLLVGGSIVRIARILKSER